MPSHGERSSERSKLENSFEELPETIAPPGSDSSNASETDAGSLGQGDQATAEFVSDTVAPGAVRSDANTADFSFSPPNLDAVTSAFDASSVEARRPKQIGDYQIDRVLGRGGMGIVYKARQTKLGRDVALKMVLAGSHASNELLARFIAEAKAVAHLQHPNIVQIFEVGEHDNLPFFSLEFVDGPSLDKRIGGKPLSPDEAAQLTITLCQAMQYAHDHGVLHRDLKPANVLVSSAGVAKVTDFGLAKRLEDSDDSSSTRTGTIMGTPSYMSPEQARGAVHELGPATDQYSIGAILYEFLTGRPPFTSPKPVETIMQVLNNEPVPPKQLQPKLPIDIETICLKALQKEPGKRYASCTEMAADLGRFLRNEPILARPVSRTEQAWRWCRRNPLVASLSLAAGLGLIAVAGISTWSAYTLTTKNKLIEEQANIAKTNEKRALEQEALAKRNEQRALEQEGIAKSRAESLTEAVKKIFVSANAINIEENPRMEEARNGIVNVLVPLLEKEVLEDLPEDDRAQLVKLGLQKSVADTYSTNNMKENALQLYVMIEKAFAERAERKKSDAARSNHITGLRSLGALKREAFRDMEASQAYFRKQLAVAEDVWNNSRGDDTGQGKYSEFQRVQLLARAHFDLALNLYRMGILKECKPHFETSLNGFKKLTTLLSSDPYIVKLPPAEQRNMQTYVERTLVNTELAHANLIYRLGEEERAEPIFRKAAEYAKSTYEKDIFNSWALRDYTGQLGMLAEFLCQTGRTEEGVQLLEKSVELATKMLSYAPRNSELQRVYALAQYRLCQWRQALSLPDAETPGLAALKVRRERVKLDPQNDRYRVELMYSESQIGDLGEAVKMSDAFTAQPNVDNELLQEVARCQSLIAGRTSDEKQRLEHLEKGTAALRRAIAQGYEDMRIVKKEIDFATLLKYGPFQSLVGLRSE